MWPLGPPREDRIVAAEAWFAQDDAAVVAALHSDAETGLTRG